MVLLQSAKVVGDEVPMHIDDSSIFYSLRARIVQIRKESIPLRKFCRTLYLFTRADISTFMVPTTLFALFGALSGTALCTQASPGVFKVISRLPSIIILVWSNLLVFDIANQRLPDAVLEDKLNKPSRPLPSGLITTCQARRLLLVSLPVVLALSYYLGPWQETLLLFSLNWMYNDLKGCDEDFIIRNLLIAIAYGLYNSAALRIACGAGSSITTLGSVWIFLVSCLIFTTEHICDLKDQAGDKARGRRSAPIVLGDGVARWTVAVPIAIWSLACPFFFGLGYLGYLLPMTCGLVVATRTVLFRSYADDALTWKIWALWTVIIFSLPLVQDHSVITSCFEYLADRLYLGSSPSGPLNLVGVSSIAMILESRKLRGYIFAKEFGARNDTLVKVVGM